MFKLKSALAAIQKQQANFAANFDFDSRWKHLTKEELIIFNFYYSSDEDDSNTNTAYTDNNVKLPLSNVSESKTSISSKKLTSPDMTKEEGHRNTTHALLHLGRCFKDNIINIFLYSKIRCSWMYCMSWGGRKTCGNYI